MLFTFNTTKYVSKRVRVPWYNHTHLKFCSCPTDDEFGLGKVEFYFDADRTLVKVVESEGKVDVSETYVRS